MYEPRIAALATVKKGIGAGQVYNNDIKKAIYLWLLTLACIFLIPATFMLSALIGLPILWIYSIIDAYKTAKAKNMEMYGRYTDDT